MKYFKISQYGSGSIVTIPDITEDELSNAYRVIARQIDDPKDKEFLNFYEKPYPAISRKLKNALRPYLPEVIGIPVSLTNRPLELIVIYWLLNLGLVENQGIGTSGELVMKLDDINNSSKKLFKTRIGLREYVIADFDVVEVILRNSIKDIQFTEITVI